MSVKNADNMRLKNGCQSIFDRALIFFPRSYFYSELNCIEIIKESVKTRRQTESCRQGSLKSKILTPGIVSFTKWPQEARTVTAGLVSWGLVVETVETRRNDRERQLEISVPTPLARRLNLDARTDKQVLQEKVLKLRRERLSLGNIAKELGIAKWAVQRIIES